MDSNFKKVARWGSGWQASDGWRVHTVDSGRAEQLADGYLALLSSLCKWKLVKTRTTGIDIGAGAGFLTAAFARRGIEMIATEIHQHGIDLIRRENPGLPVRQLDVTDYRDDAVWDFMFCRELYPFTRTNSFSDQLEIILRMVDSLKPGGVLLLVGSDVAWPHCLDYRMLIKALRADIRTRHVSTRYLEPLIWRCGRWRLGLTGYWIFFCLLWPYTTYLRRVRGWASICAIAIQKR